MSYLERLEWGAVDRRLHHRGPAHAAEFLVRQQQAGDRPAEHGPPAVFLDLGHHPFDERAVRIRRARRVEQRLPLLREAFEAFVDSQGLAVEDFVLGNASAFDFEAETGVLVAGARTTDPEVTPDLEAFVQLLLTVDPSLTFGGSDMAVEPGQVDGRDVLLVSMEVLQDGEFNESDHVGVTTGGYALLLQGDPDPIREILAALPAEAEADEEADADAEAEESDESEEG